jgi:CheY-like chemotaxis protein
VTQASEGPRDNTLRVLLVDDRPERRQLVSHLVLSTGLVDPDILEAGDATVALEILEGHDRDVAVVEIQLPVDRGLEAIAALRTKSPQLRIVVYSFCRDADTKALALAAGADTYVDKPASTALLRDVLQAFLDSAPPVTTRPVKSGRSSPPG